MTAASSPCPPSGDQYGTARALTWLVEVVTKEGLGRLARRLVHFVLAVVLELHSRRESVRGLRTGVSATGNRGPHTDVKDEGGSCAGVPVSRGWVRWRWRRAAAGGRLPVGRAEEPAREGAPATFTCHSGQWGLTVQSLMAAQASGASPLGCQ